MMTNSGMSGTALLIHNYGPSYVGIGSGSGAVTVNRSGLIYETDRNPITGSDASTVKQAGITADFGSVEMSGTIVSEFGAFTNVSGGQAWVVEGFAGITFDGSNELQTQITFEIY